MVDTPDMGEVRLDLFRLDDGNEKIKGSIKITLTEELKTAIRNIVEEVKTKEKLKTCELSEKLGTKYSTLRMSFRRNRTSLAFVKKLLDLCPCDKKVGILDGIKELSSGTGNNYVKVKAPRFLSENLCKIAGAIVADGNLYLGKCNRKWQIKIGDQYKDNLELFAGWVNDEFGTRPEIKKDKKN